MLVNSISRFPAQVPFLKPYFQFKIIKINDLKIEKYNLNVINHHPRNYNLTPRFTT